MTWRGSAGKLLTPIAVAAAVAGGSAARAADSTPQPFDPPESVPTDVDSVPVGPVLTGSDSELRVAADDEHDRVAEGPSDDDEADEPVDQCADGEADASPATAAPGPVVIAQPTAEADDESDGHDDDEDEDENESGDHESGDHHEDDEGPS